MRKSFFIVCVCAALSFPAFVFGYGEGPSGSGRWAEGRVTYGDGSKCGKCRVSLGTNNGLSKTGFTDGSGYYKIYVASRYVKSVYVSGREVWSGSRDAKGGTRIDVKVR